MRFGCFAVASLLLCPVSPAWCQLPGGPHYDTLVGMPSVQKELEIPPPQLRELAVASARNRASLQQIFTLPEHLRASKAHELMERGDQIIFSLLKPRQKERLRQIQWQQQGCRAFAHPSVIQDLGLTNDQVFQINTVLDEVRSHANELLMAPGKPPPHPETIRKHLAKVDKPAMARIQLVLNKEQQAIWKTLLGKPFRGEIRYGPATR